ncbi:cell surface protein [Lactococcus cremoris subsp. cremoris NZ9000]|nr:cell surface protein [Lactococcus cremoris subsp. cremoris NZ9000]
MTAGVTNKNKSGILAKLANPTSWVMPHLTLSQVFRVTNVEF